MEINGNSTNVRAQYSCKHHISYKAFLKVVRVRVCWLQKPITILELSVTNESGEKIYKDDDKKGECFRVYSTADESFLDHSIFLSGRGRYADLFTLEITDYKGWAKGLRKAGYATSKTYSTRLIELIEKYELSQYDAYSNLPGSPVSLNNDSNQTIGGASDVKSDIISIQNGHQVLKMNARSKYVVAQEGDTYYRISREFGLGLWQLYKYNDRSSKNDLLKNGDKIYIQPKKRSSKTLESYTVKKAQNLSIQCHKRQESS